MSTPIPAPPPRFFAGRDAVWLWLAAILLLAFGLRFWQLSEFPAGLYRDEAHNGLDALTVLAGERPLYFPNNNGREPLYIYMVAAGVALFGRSVIAVRAAAAVVGTVTTLAVFGLSRRWYGLPAGLMAAFLWATTVWTIHLSRIGLRVILLVPVLTCSAWLATAAWDAVRDRDRDRERDGDREGSVYKGRLLWVAAGLVYALSFYTYLAGRFTPALLVAVLLYGWVIGRLDVARLRPILLWGGLGLVLGVLPLLLAAVNQPEILLGRPGQVSIFNPQISKGDLWGTLWHHWWRSLGLFVWRGDTIIRHNPPGRPLFDIFIAVPFIVGCIIMIRRWRQPVMFLPLLWVGIMLWPTILAEDAPHFLRAAGILPAALLIPAVGLSEMASWPKLARLNRQILIGILLIGSLSLTVRDYFFNYYQLPDTAYLFEAAATFLVEDVTQQEPQTEVWIDRRYRDGWPSVQFLLDPQHRINWIDPPNADRPFILPEGQPTTLYVWPFEPSGRELIARAVVPPAVVAVEVGPLARGDLEPQPYPLYLRYAIEPSPELDQPEPLAVFASPDQPWEITLAAGEVATEQLSNDKLTVNLFWSTRIDQPIDTPLTVFVHIVDLASGTLIGQDDAQPAAGFWPLDRLEPGVVIGDSRELSLKTPFDSGQHQIFVGVYPSGQPESRLFADVRPGYEGYHYSENTVQLNKPEDP